MKRLFEAIGIEIKEFTPMGKRASVQKLAESLGLDVQQVEQKEGNCVGNGLLSWQWMVVDKSNPNVKYTPADAKEKQKIFEEKINKNNDSEELELVKSFETSIAATGDLVVASPVMNFDRDPEGMAATMLPDSLMAVYISTERSKFADHVGFIIKDEFGRCHVSDASQFVSNRGQDCGSLARLLHQSTQSLFGSQARRASMSAQLFLPRKDNNGITMS